MEPGFWHERWRNNEIGFHQGTAHKALAAHWASLGLPPGSRMFVPLAGKSLDLVWLARQGHDVVGIELSEIAVRDFERENGALPRVDLRCGDLFDLTAASLGPIDAVFDRASLVALPREMRGRYAAKLTELSHRGTKSLLVTLEYDQSQMPGPPHSVPESEVRELYAASHTIELLERDACLADFPKFAERGVKAIAEVVYRMTRR